MRRGVGIVSAFVVAVAVICAATTTATGAEAPPAIWSRRVPGTAAGLDVAADGTVVIAASSRDDYPGGVAILLGLTPAGELTWRSSWAPAGGYARARGVAVAGGRPYLVGVVSPEVACDPELGSFGWFVRGADETGGTRWARLAPGWECCSIGGGSVAAGGGLVAIGTTGYIEGYEDVHGRIRAFSAGNGRHLWTNRFEPFPVRDRWGTDADNVMGLSVDARGRTYAAGWAWRNPRRGSGADHEAVLMALDAGGHRRWVRVLGEAGLPWHDQDRGTDVDVNSGRVLFGALMDTPGGRVARVVLYGTGGDRRWIADFPGGTAWYGPEVKVALGTGGAAFVANTRRGVLTVRKLTPRGALAWEMAMPHRRVVDLAATGGRLYVLTPGKVWTFATG
jgi:hypothetical protein